MASLPSLTTLNVSDNDVTSLLPLAGLTSLRELWVANNRVEALQEVAALSPLPHLSHLMLYGNPVCKLHDPEALR